MKWTNRDVVAALGALVLAKLTTLYTTGSESMEASINLAFYYVYKAHVHVPDRLSVHAEETEKVVKYNTARPELLDIDGDGIYEALVVPSLKDHLWQIQILDLRPLHHPKKAIQDDPIVPKLLFQSGRKLDNDHPEKNSKVAPVPVKITTGHMILLEKLEDQSEIRQTEHENITDKSQYFCGIDWHDARTSCSTPCPNMNECPNGENCFADTGCFPRIKDGKSVGGINFKELSRTPNESLPIIATVWSDGTVTLHSIIGKVAEELQLMEIWNLKILSLNTGNGNPDTFIDYMELDLIIDSEIFGTFGTIFILATYQSDNVVNVLHVAIDAHNGNILWRHSSQDKPKKMNKINLRNETIWTSMERRRSRANLYFDDHDHGFEDFERSEDCLHHFHADLMDSSSHMLPHSYWEDIHQYGATAQDTQLIISHLDRKRSHRSNYGTIVQPKKAKKINGWVSNKFRNTFSVPKAKLNFQNSNKNRFPYGKPNALIHHNNFGISVLALKNGKQVCHLTLPDRAMYGDINEDGVIDKLEVVFHEKEINAISVEDNPLCEGRIQHGINPMMEGDVVQVPVCIDHPTMKYKKKPTGMFPSSHSTRPLLVERFNDLASSERNYDIIYALNHGLMKRFDSRGQLQWSATSHIPSWDNNRSVLLDRINFQGSTTHGTSVSAIRPIILSGDDSLALYSSKHGRLLDKIPFPQLAVSRPSLGDFNGDGTTDVILCTTDGVWGFQIEIYSDKMTFMNVMNGLLFALICVAIVYSSFMNVKRST